MGTGIKASSLRGSADLQDITRKKTGTNTGCPTTKYVNGAAAINLLQVNPCDSGSLALLTRKSKLGPDYSICVNKFFVKGSNLKGRDVGALTRRSDMGVLSLAGRCCSRARTMQLAIIVARIMYSNGV